MILYATSEIPVAPARSGSLRVAIEDDVSWLWRWMLAFAEEVRLTPPEREASEPTTIAAVGKGRILLWEEDGVARAMVGWRDTTDTSARIGPVFTPPQWRRRGYASASVAALTARLLREGRRSCRLFADVSNAAANEMYRRVGYRPVCMYQEFSFGEEAQ